MNSRILQTLPIALTLAASSLLAQASPMPGESIASIDQMGWRLVDLAPDDGIAPWIEFTEGWVRLTNFTDHPASAGPIGIQALPLPTDTVADADGVSEAWVSPTSAQATARHIGPYRFPSDFRIDGDMGYVNYANAQVHFDRRPMATNNSGIQFRISPYTELVFEGKAQVRTFADASLGVQSDDLLPLDLPLALVSKASVSGHMWHASGDHDSFRLDSRSQSSLIAGEGTGPVQDSRQRDFILTFRNDFDFETHGALELWVSSSVTASVVPEPSTFFLLGIGLLGMAGAARLRANRT